MISDSDYSQSLQDIYESACIQRFMNDALEMRAQHGRNAILPRVERGLKWARVGDYRVLAGCKIAIPVDDT